jgi:hypothetical protein
MKTLLIAYLFFLSLFCCGQKNRYNDWFDMNLKGNPKTVSEFTIIPLSFIARGDQEKLMNASLSELLIQDEFHFDSLGLISKWFHKNFLKKTGVWYYYKTEDYTRYTDSIILPCLSENGQQQWLEKRYLVKNEFLGIKIIDNDTTTYERDLLNRILISSGFSVNIDNPKRTIIENEYNNNNDIKTEKRKEDIFTFGSTEHYAQESITTYDYIYDSYNNWILRICKTDDEISTITERKIKYD